MCRFSPADLAGFLLGFLPFGISAIAGMVRGGFGWYLLGWVAFAIIFFFIWEARVLCSHCPYWAEDTRVLHCHANYGVFKIWQYDPTPMSTWEKAQFIFGAAFLISYPLVFLVLGGQYLLLVLALSSAIGFAYNLRRNACSRCVNLSCPMNTVPKPIADAYLRRNPVMLRAWEQSGYRLDGGP
jgi:hypothetical protein